MILGGDMKTRNPVASNAWKYNKTSIIRDKRNEYLEDILDEEMGESLYEENPEEDKECKKK